MLMLQMSKINILSVEEGQGNGHRDYSFFLDTDICTLNDIKSIKIECR